LGDGGQGQLQGIARIVQGAAGIVNLEGPVAVRPAISKPPSILILWNTPAALRELLPLNVRVAGLANNHAGDAGLNGRQNTERALQELGIVPTSHKAPAIVEISHLKVVVTASDLTGGVPTDLDEELHRARGQGDILIATFHVSGPPSYLPRPELRRAVEIAYRAGAMVIASHGSHAIGPVERRGQSVIAWGLGNVAFACNCTDQREAILLRVAMKKTGSVKAEVLPIQAGINGSPAAPSSDVPGILRLLESIGSSRLVRHGDSASF
jgi:poly-gamma-glutamate capsule biosynthesis protein CapA/YwtB (metallophosphatase superfamily)